MQRNEWHHVTSPAKSKYCTRWAWDSVEGCLSHSIYTPESCQFIIKSLTVWIRYRVCLVHLYLHMEGCGTAEPVCECRVRVVALVVKLVESVLHLRLTLWMGDFCNFPEVAWIVDSHVTDDDVTLYVNRKNVAPWKHNKIKHFSHHSGYVIFWHGMPNTAWMCVCTRAQQS